MAIRRFNGNEVGNVAAGIEFYGNNYSSGCNSKGESFRNDSTIYFDSREEIKWFSEFLRALKMHLILKIAWIVHLEDIPGGLEKA